MNIQTDSQVADTGYANYTGLQNSAFAVLPHELILNIIRLLGLQLPHVSAVCRELNKFAIDKVLLAEEFKAFELWTKNFVETNPNKNSILAEVEALIENWKENYWKAFGGLSVLVRRLLDDLDPKQLAALDIPMVDLSKAPLMRHYIQNQFAKAWERHINATALRGYFSISFGLEFTDSSFREFLNGLKCIPGIIHLTIDGNLSHEQVGVFADFITLNQLSFEYQYRPRPSVQPRSDGEIIEIFCMQIESEGARDFKLSCF